MIIAYSHDHCYLKHADDTTYYYQNSLEVLFKDLSIKQC